MTMKMNALMRELLRSCAIDVNFRIPLVSSLKKLLKEDIVIVDNCYYFHKTQASYSDELVDHIGNECFHNKICLKYMAGLRESTFEDCLKSGISFINELANKIKNLNASFVIILCQHQEFVDVRFHAKHEGEVWLEDDIEIYIDEALMVIET